MAGSMPRYRLDLEYAGTRYRGWQVQANARTVQGELLTAARGLTDRPPLDLQGAGRTDAGVHALHQVAHLDLVSAPPPMSLLLGLNDALPPDINVLRVARVRSNFHARHDAVARRYLYQIARRRTAFAKPYVWWVKDTLDVASMQRTARAFVGRHDFRQLSQADADTTSTLVEVHALSVEECGDLLVCRIEASHFLWRMVRRIMGVLVEVGRGKLTEAAAKGLIAGASPVDSAALTAPPSGLFLERVIYPDEPVPHPTSAPVRLDTW